MQQKINAIFTKKVLELNGSLRFNDSLSSCNRAQVSTIKFRKCFSKLMIPIALLEKFGR